MQVYHNIIHQSIHYHHLYQHRHCLVRRKDGKCKVIFFCRLRLLLRVIYIRLVCCCSESCSTHVHGIIISKILHVVKNYWLACSTLFCSAFLLCCFSFRQDKSSQESWERQRPFVKTPFSDTQTARKVYSAITKYTTHTTIKKYQKVSKV